MDEKDCYPGLLVRGSDPMYHDRVYRLVSPVTPQDPTYNECRAYGAWPVWHGLPVSESAVSNWTPDLIAICMVEPVEDEFTRWVEKTRWEAGVV